MKKNGSCLIVCILLLGSSLPLVGAEYQITGLENISDSNYGQAFETQNPIFKFKNIPYLSDETIWDAGYSVKQTVDGGSIIAGQTVIIDEPPLLYASLIKFDSDGNQEWYKLFEGLGLAAGCSVQQTNDNGFIITGYTAQTYGEYYRILLLKTDQNGNEEWEKTFQIMDACLSSSVIQTSDEGYVMTGLTYDKSTGNVSSLILKTDNNGNLDGYKTFFEDEYCSGYSVHQTNDGGYVLVANRVNFGVPPSYQIIEEIYLIKCDSDLNMDWYKIFSGIG